jgi:hypothetical protein
MPVTMYQLIKIRETGIINVVTLIIPEKYSSAGYIVLPGVDTQKRPLL